MAAHIPNSDSSDEKRTPEFVFEVQAINYNDFSKSIRSKASDMGVYEFLIKQVVHEDIWYFSYKMRKGQFLSQALKDKRKDYAAKLLNKFKHFL